MYSRGRPFTTLTADGLGHLFSITGQCYRRPRRRRWFLISAVIFICGLSLILLNASSPIGCKYLDPCAEDTILNILGNESLPLELCPLCHQGPNGLVNVNDTVMSFDQMERQLPWVDAGGRYQPKDCTARQRVAIVIPYRNRREHLQVFLNNIHPFLRNQSAHYGIYVVEQAEGRKFNRGTLLNIGFKTAMQEEAYDCFIFHDVDYIPLDLRNTYACSTKPKHLSVIVDTFDDKLPYAEFFGGVAALTTEQFRIINGFPNRYWGWGGEDDDIVERFKQVDYTIVRHTSSIARYTMLHHTRDRGNPVNPKRYALLYEAHKVYTVDGLSNLKYTLKSLEKKKLFTRVYVDLVAR